MTADTLRSPANGLGALAGGGLCLVGHAFHHEISLVHVLHELFVKLAAAALGIGRLDGGGHAVVAADGHLEAAPAPQKELDQPVHIIGVGRGHVGRAVDLRLIDADLPGRALHRDAQRLLRALCIALEEGAQGHEARVQLGQVLHRDIHIEEFHRTVSPFFIFFAVRTRRTPLPASAARGARIFMILL